MTLTHAPIVFSLATHLAWFNILSSSANNIVPQDNPCSVVFPFTDSSLLPYLVLSDSVYSLSELSILFPFFLSVVNQWQG